MSGSRTAAQSALISRARGRRADALRRPLWETWTGPNGEMETAAIVTTEANAAMAAVHHRAPVIVAPGQFDFCARLQKRR